MTDREIIKEYLTVLENMQRGSGTTLHEARSSFLMLFTRDYDKQTGCYWIRTHADEIEPLLEKQPQKMTLHEALVCLTNIIARDRIYGSIGGCENSGAMVKLLRRYLELTKEEDA